MTITRQFMEDGVSLETLIEMVLDKNIDAIIDSEIFDSQEKGKFGGIEDDSKQNK